MRRGGEIVVGREAIVRVAPEIRLVIFAHPGQLLITSTAPTIADIILSASNAAALGTP